MNENALKWVWLTTLKGMTGFKISSLLNKFNDIDEIYNAKEADYKGIELIRPNDIKALCVKDTYDAEIIIKRTESLGGYILTIDSEAYPERLKMLADPPYVLYVKGSLRLDSEMCSIGIVGTRHTVEYGELATGKLGFELAKAGFTVVSGMAYGVDSIAASAALRAGGNTIAVLGCGIDIVYPSSNRQLKDYIEKHGAVVSEYPPLTPPYRTNFPHRNRIIAGLSDCVLITQAPAKSGSLITARYAHDLGRDVYSIPASIFDENFVGNNNLLKAGAIPVTHPKDIAEAYQMLLEDFRPSENRNYIKVLYNSKKSFPQKVKNTLKKITGKEIKNEMPVEMQMEREQKHEKSRWLEDVNFETLLEEERTIVKSMADCERISVDEIIRRTGMETAKVNSTLTIMEMKRIVKKYPGNCYELD